ncbi:MAG: tRNA epoxyqueuosine(34) reductase QueG [Thermoanaerobaculia bacterium]
MTAPPSRRVPASELADLARRVGFTRAGVARLGPATTGEALRRWLRRGDHAGMSYLERRVEERLDPGRLLPGARSVVCVALAYDGAPAAGDLWSRVARYARGDDYHEVMTARLARLEGALRERYPGVATRKAVDTSPVLEREWAARAGLGAVGKHTCLIDPESGSYLLLGELFTSLAVAPETPVADLCGNCTRCLEACPTGALPEPYRLDSRRCISYWTIEHRGAIPAAQRPAIGEWVFGCDLCQEACPWNRRAPASGDPGLELPETRSQLDLVGLLTLDRERYVELFRRSPMKRAKLEGLQRNAAVAMGNRGDRRYVPALAAALGSESESVRGHAAWALGRIGGEAARRALLAGQEGESSPAVRAEIEAALAELGFDSRGAPCVDSILPSSQ